MLEMIVAADANGSIGYKGLLPWSRLPEDMAWFRSNTEGKTLVMGRKTFESVRVPLKGRKVCVLSRSMNHKSWADEILRHPDEVFDLKGDVVICGGANVYRTFIPSVTTIYWTRVYGLFEADTFFPSPLFKDGLPSLIWPYRATKVTECDDGSMFRLTRKTF